MSLRNGIDPPAPSERIELRERKLQSAPDTPLATSANDSEAAILTSTESDEEEFPDDDRLGKGAWGVIQAELSTSLAPASTLAFIGSIGACTPSLFGAWVTKVVSKYGNHRTAIFAGICLSLSAFLSSFTSKSVPGLFITQGALFGLGNLFSYISAAPLSSQYFKRKRGLANGLVFAGGGVGAGVMALSMNALLRKVSIEWLFRIIALLDLAITMPAAWHLRPRLASQVVHRLEWDLFKDPKFVLLAIQGLFAVFPGFVPPFFLPSFAISIGLGKNTGAALLAGWNFSSCIGRIGFGYLAGENVLGPVNSLLLSEIVCGLSMLVLWMLSSALLPLIMFVILNGASAGAFYAVMPSVMASQYRSTPVAMSLTMVSLFICLGQFLGAPIAGWMLEASGGAEGGLPAYRPAIAFAGSFCLCAATIVASVKLMCSKKFLKVV